VKTVQWRDRFTAQLNDRFWSSGHAQYQQSGALSGQRGHQNRWPGKPMAPATGTNNFLRFAAEQAGGTLRPGQARESETNHAGARCTDQHRIKPELSIPGDQITVTASNG